MAKNGILMFENLNKARLFRFIFGAVGLLFIIVSLSNLYINASKVTDENVFADPSSRLYFTKSFLADKSNSHKFKNKDIYAGDMLLEINGKRIKNAERLENIFSNIPDSSNITFKVVSAKRKAKIEFIISKDKFPLQSIRYLNSAVYILHVDNGGASDRAGLRFGDVLVKINGQEFADAYEADRLMRSYSIGKILVYEVLRDGEVLNLNIKLAKFGISFPSLSLFLVGLLFMGTGLFFGMTRPRLIAARMIGIAMLLLGFTLAISANGIFWGGGIPGIVLSLLINGAAPLFGISTFIHSFLYFPSETPELFKKKLLIYFPHFISIASLLFFVSTIVFQIPNSATSNTKIIIFGLYLISIIVMSQHYNKYSSKETKRISRVIKIVLIFNLILFAANPIIAKYEIFASVLPYLFTFTVLIPLSYIYTVARYRLLDLDIRLRKNNQYVIISTLWKIIVFCLFSIVLWVLIQIKFELPNLHFTGTSILILDKPLRPELFSIYYQVIIIFVSLLITALFIKIMRYGIAVLDTKYYRGKFDYRKAAEEIVEVMEKNITLKALLQALVKKLARLVHVKKIGLLLFNEKGKLGKYDFYGTISPIFTDQIIKNIDLLIENSLQIRQSFRSEYLPNTIKEILLDEEFYYLVPVKSKGKTLGLYILGEKLSETPYNSVDLEFLISIANQTSAAIENALLYEDLAKQERIKHELELARSIQAASLPQQDPNIAGLDISGISIPALEVGGDFYDYLCKSKNDIMIVAGDVSGKGTSAALYMSKAQGIIRTLFDFNLSPKELFVRANSLLYRYIEKHSFISVIGIRINTLTNEFVLSRAGHLPLFYYNSKIKKIEKITPKGIVLGISTNTLFETNLEEISRNYNSGDIMMLCSDGAIEARDEFGNEFSDESLMKIVINNAEKSSEQIRDVLLEEIQTFTNSPAPFDDMTIVIIKAD